MRKGDTRSESSMVLIASDAQLERGRFSIQHPRHGAVVFERTIGTDTWVVVSVEKPDEGR